MPDETHTVHEFAALAGVTVKALHHYDRIGLLKPARTAAGYRLYVPADLTRLRQILALRSLGLPLRRIGNLLAPGAPPLRLTLQQQRRLLEDRRRLIDRAIRALETADAGLEAAAGSDEALTTLIEAIGMHDSVDEMRKYYSDEAWDRWRHYYEAWPSPEWRELYHDVNALLDRDAAPDATGSAAQALGARWLALDTADTRDGAIRTGLRRAWMDREQWPAWLQARAAEHRVDRATRFVNTVLWERWEAERLARERAGNTAPPRVSNARIGLYRDCAAALDARREFESAPSLVARHRAILEAECGGDTNLAAEQIRAWRARHHWPPGLRRYIASTYAMDVATWERVADFLDGAVRRAG